MPVVVQVIARLLPACYFVEILRSVFLKGTPVTMILTQITALGIYAFVLVALATRAFHKRLE